MSNDLSIHPDFRSVRSMKTPTGRLPLALMNGFLGMSNALALPKYRHLIGKQTITGADGHRIPLLLIRPEGLPASAPALVYCHGGAFVFKHFPQHIDNAVRYARGAHCLVVFVDYRLAPGHPFPAAFDDCHSTLQWTGAQAGALGIDPRRVAIGGDSAGGTLAAGMAQKAAHEGGLKVCGQLLIYPATDSSDEWPSGRAFVDVPPFKALSRNTLWGIYLGHPLAAGMPPYAVPMQGDLSGVAPAYVETAEFDPLRDEGQAYAEALLARGVDVTRNATKNTIHGFDLLAPKSAISRAAVDSRIRFLQQVFQQRV